MKKISLTPSIEKRLLVAFFCLYGSLASAQPTLPDPYPTGSKISYVRVWNAFFPETNGNAFIERFGNDPKRKTDYFDGLGRNIQTQNFNVIYARQYDKAGRELLQYLPFPGYNDALRTNPFAEQAAWYQANYSGEVHFYNKTETEQSPLSRINKSLAPGMKWVGSNRGVEVQSEFNISTEGIRVWDIDFTSGSIPTSNSTYATGKLSKSVMLDEKLKKVYVYTDMEGKTILRKVQEKELGSGLEENGHGGWLCTYYVYDDLGQLRSTITPRAVKYLENTNWVFSSTDVYQELCFWYEMDERARLIIKHSPGAGQIYLVYDNKDRLVLSQNENQRARIPKQWTFFLYDQNDRCIATGLFDNDATRSIMENHVKALNSGLVNITIYAGSNESIMADNPVAGGSYYCNSCTNTVINTVNYYDSYSFSGVKTFNTNFNFAPQEGQYGPLTATVEPTVASQRVLGLGTGSKTRVLDQNYDDGNPNNDLFLSATIYYDDKGRAIQTLRDNAKGAVDHTTTQYDFASQVLGICENHTMPSTPTNGYQVISRYQYDWLRRLTTFSKKFDVNDYKKLASYEYDEFNRVKVKKLSPDFNSGAGIETLNFTYNIRGWLNGINKDWTLASTQLNQWDHFFGMYMGYDNLDNLLSSGKEQYNGNLGGIIWKTQGDNMPKRYEYSYDNANRFTAASYKQKENPTETTWNSLKMDFSVSDIIYDENNNLKQMFQKGVIPGNNSPIYIDKLVYEHRTVAGGEWSNQLKKVFDQTTDLTSTNNGALGDFKDEIYNVNTDDYTFDGNGNLVKDQNKKIRASGNANGVIYNYLDKAQQITIDGKSVTEYIYDADGTKLGKKVTNTTTGSWVTTWYMGNFIYEETSSNTKLAMILHEEGRVRVFEPVVNPRLLQENNFPVYNNVDFFKGVFEYFIKDNLQNTRAIVTEETHGEYNNCGLETADANYEERMFGQILSNGNPDPGTNEVLLTRVDKITWAPGWNANTSAKVSKLSWYGNKVGPNVILKVMAGDEVVTKADYYYTGIVDNSGNNNILNPLLSSLLGVLSNPAPTGDLHSSSGNITSNYNNYPGELGNFLSNQSNGGNATPQAYLNIMFFDENFNFVPYDNVTGLGSNSWRVSTPDDGQSIPQHLSRAPKNGYAFVYLSNESKTAVYFDNFDVTHLRGKLIEENAYYAYGLKIRGISGKAFNKGENNYGYQGDFSESEEETGWDEFYLRNYDAQIGRWTGIDPYDEFAGPYIGMGSNPVNLIDPSGGNIFDLIGNALTDNWLGTAFGAVTGAAFSYITSGGANGSNTAAKTVLGFFGGAILGNLTQEFGYTLSDLLSDAFNVVEYIKDSKQDAGFVDNGWKDLYKKDLVDYMKTFEGNQSPTEQEIGTRFEDMIEKILNDMKSMRKFNVYRDPDVSTGGDRNTKPDFKGRLPIEREYEGPYGLDRRKWTEYAENAFWIEVKAKGGGLYLSSNTGQLEGHIDNMVRDNQSNIRRYSLFKFKPLLYVITTADVNYSPSVGVHAALRGVYYQHFHVQYKIDKGIIKLRINSIN